MEKRERKDDKDYAAEMGSSTPALRVLHFHLPQLFADVLAEGHHRSIYKNPPSDLDDCQQQ